MSTIRKTCTIEFKAKVVREILKEEKSLSQIASEYATHVNVIFRWYKTDDEYLFGRIFKEATGTSVTSR